MPKHPKTVSVTIIARNEARSIGEIIKKAKPYADEILVVDGHSTDNTRKVAEKLGARVVLDNKIGKGDAIRVGIREVKCDIIVFIDADGSHDPNDIPRLVKPIQDGKADHVTASRMKGGSDELHGDLGKFVRMFGSDIITLGINYWFNVRLTDSQNGFRAISTASARTLKLKEKITTIEQEMIIKSLKKGYKIAEIPSHEYARKYGQSVINVKKIWWRYVYSWLKYLFFG